GGRHPPTQDDRRREVQAQHDARQRHLRQVRRRRVPERGNRSAQRLVRNPPRRFLIGAGAGFSHTSRPWLVRNPPRRFLIGAGAGFSHTSRPWLVRNPPRRWLIGARAGFSHTSRPWLV